MKEPDTVEEYVAAAPAWAKATLEEIRKAIKSGAPEAKESISYRMPYYSQNGRLAYFGSYTNHCSFHWISAKDKKTFAKELARQRVVGSTLQIPRGDKVPSELIRRIVSGRVKENQQKNS